MQNTVICLTTFLKSRKDFVRSHFVCFADRQSICTHEYVLLADAKSRHSKQSTTLTDGQDHCVQISKKKLLLRGRRAVVIHCGELAEKVLIGACVGLTVRENFQQHGAVALLLDENGQQRRAIGRRSSRMIGNIVCGADALGRSVVRAHHERFAGVARTQSRKLAEDGTSTVVEQQNTQVAAEMLIPQRIVIVEETEVADDTKHVIIGG